jgi:hypothetical protein
MLEQPKAFVLLNKETEHIQTLYSFTVIVMRPITITLRPIFGPYL